MRSPLAEKTIKRLRELEREDLTCDDLLLLNLGGAKKGSEKADLAMVALFRCLQQGSAGIIKRLHFVSIRKNLWNQWRRKAAIAALQSQRRLSGHLWRLDSRIGRGLERFRRS